jgi:acyl-CoA synthetase (AMP-forming)/AMP-acid ligase II
MAAQMPWARFINLYGQSETRPLNMLRPGDPPNRAGTFGRIAAGVEMDVVDKTGAPVPPGTVGEIVVSGATLMDGYFEEEAETAAFFRTGDGGAWTDDLATMDEDRFVTLVGQWKDMIVSGGVNVYPH